MNKPIDLNTEGLIYGLDRLIVRGGVGYSRIYLELVPLFIRYVIYLLMSKVFGKPNGKSRSHSSWVITVCGKCMLSVYNNNGAD